MKRDDPKLRWIGLVVGILLAAVSTLGFVFVVIPGIGWQLGRAEPDFVKIGMMVGFPLVGYILSAACIVRPAATLGALFEGDDADR